MFYCRGYLLELHLFFICVISSVCLAIRDDEENKRFMATAILMLPIFSQSYDMGFQRRHIKASDIRYMVATRRKMYKIRITYKNIIKNRQTEGRDAFFIAFSFWQRQFQFSWPFFYKINGNDLVNRNFLARVKCTHQ